MTPKQKATEIINKIVETPITFPYIDTVDAKCIGSGYMVYKSAIKISLLLVDEIISAQWLDTGIDYWKEVKQQLEIL